MRIALASPPLIGTIAGTLPWIERFIAEAAEGGAEVICFPETCVPGIRGQEFEIEAHDPDGLRAARERVCQLAAQHGIAVIFPMEWPEAGGVLNLAWVISDSGEILGRQIKNQIAPEEDPHYRPGTERQMFEIKGVPFGIAICHEGWRYPETVRWAAVRGARIVFHPHQHGSDRAGPKLTGFGDPEAPWFEKAMICRAQENSIFFASVNFAHAFQTAATAVIGPDGTCLAHAPYGAPGVILVDLPLAEADRLYADRFAPERYQDVSS